MFRYLLLLLLWIPVLITRYNHAAGELYAVHVYPKLSVFLARIASWSHFSLEELVVVASCMLVLHRIITVRKHTWKKQLAGILEILLWVTGWFYWGWGINYFRDSFYQRMNLQPETYSDAGFRSFLQDYTLSLNESYTTFKNGIPNISWRQEIRNIYYGTPSKAALRLPDNCSEPKRLAFNTLYSKVGVMGFMGPFFNEMQLNEELLPQQYPFTYAHELAHQLGVSSEAEANYWAFKVCTASKNPQIRFSGYLGILPYVIRQTYSCFSADEYRHWISSVKPEILLILKMENRYWMKKYSTWIGNIQNIIYEVFLKSNQISNGQKNYGAVLSLIISEREQSPFTLKNPQIQ